MVADFTIAGADGREMFAQPIGKLDVRFSDGQRVAFDLLDTHDMDLRKSGRLLISADKVLWLFSDRATTLSQPAGRSGGRFVADLPDGPVKDALSDLPELRCLMTLTSGTLDHREGALVDDEGKTRVRFALMDLAGADGAAVLCRTEAMRGYENAHDRLVAHLQSAPGATPADTDRVHALLMPKFRPYIAKPATPFAPQDPAIVAATTVISAYLDVVRRNEAGVIADLDTEFLHDYRVALRKIRSVLSLFKGVYSESRTAELKRTFSDLMAPTGRLRDLDVYLLERDTYFDLLPETLQGGLKEMSGRFQRSRRAELTRLARRLESPEYLRQMEDLQALFSDPGNLQRGPEAGHAVLPYARALIWKRYRKVCRMGRSINDQTPDETVHELRINCKKLRYLMEFFTPLFPKRDMKAMISHLKGLQDNLGLFNDYSVQQVALQTMLDDDRSKDPAKKLEMAKSVGALIAVLHGRQLEERARVTRSFAVFDSAEVQQAFRDHFHQITV